MYYKHLGNTLQLKVTAQLPLLSVCHPDCLKAYNSFLSKASQSSLFFVIPDDLALLLHPHLFLGTDE